MVVPKYANPITITQSEEATQFQLVTFVVGLPSKTHDASAEIQARPFEFVLDLPSKFSAMCPFCYQGFYISASDVIEQYGFKFVCCPECGVGTVEPPKVPTPFTDPFVNPFSSKQLARCELDETITPINDIVKDNSLTVAQKMSRSICKE
jgi:hypothetical protein